MVIPSSVPLRNYKKSVKVKSSHSHANSFLDKSPQSSIYLNKMMKTHFQTYRKSTFFFKITYRIRQAGRSFQIPVSGKYMQDQHKCSNLLIRQVLSHNMKLLLGTS